MNKYTRLKNLKPAWRSRRFFAAAVFGLILVSTPFTDALTTRDKIYPGTTVGKIEIGGMSSEEGASALEKYFTEFLGQPLVFTLENKQTALLLDKILAFDVASTINNALRIGHQDSFTQTIQQRLNARLSGIPVDPIFTINNDNLISSLRSAFPEYGTPPQNAKFDFIFEKNKLPVISVLAEQSGKDIDSDAIISQLEKQVLSFSSAPISVVPKLVGSTITKDNLAQFLPAVRKLFEKPAPEIKFKDKKWKITYPVLASWITVQNETLSGVQDPALRDNAGTLSGVQDPALQDNAGTLSGVQDPALRDNVASGFMPDTNNAQFPALQLDKKLVSAWLDSIAKQITKNPKDAEFELSEDSKTVIKFSMAENGLTLPRDENISIITTAILKGETPELVLQTIAPKILISKAAEDYGIKELVGQGTTNFVGSPTNRIKNITRGANLLYGQIIEPDEEFSLLEHLRPFTLENKYLPELVIKAAEGKTVPEIGGGLCQIGTTMFRTVLNAGLPVTFRRNHSYRVSYYEPPVGMDATIYDPWPDFKFINDTGNRLLLTTEIIGTKITFSLWGIKDNRQVNITEPEVFNFKKPPEKKIIETLNLPPGVTKCTEHAHVGSDAKFTYTVTYQNNEIKQTEFLSHYQPWQEVCLLGVVALSEPVPPAETQTLPSADAPLTLPSP